MPAMNNPRKLAWISAALLGVAGFVLFQFFGNNVHSYFDTDSLFVWWAMQWINPRSQSEYGPLILLAAIGLAVWNWRRSPEEDNGPRPSMALVIIFAGVFLHAGGLIIEQARVSIVGLLFYLNGLAWLAGGQRAGRATAFPLAFMMFALPLEFFFDEFGFYLRLAVIQSSTALAHLIGIDVIRNGTHLISPDGSFNYDVEPACSGIRSLVALTALTLLVGYCSFRTWWRRLLLLAVAFPFAYLGNVARIFTIILAAEWFGQDAGLIVHEWFGFIVFIIVLGLALATVSALEKWLPEKPKPKRQTKPKPASAIYICTTLGIGVVSVFACVLLANRVSAFANSAEAGVKLTQNGDQPRALPSFVGDDLAWASRTARVSEIEKQMLPPDTGFSRCHYVNLDNGQSVYFSIVLSGKGRGAIHRPEICLVGQGWTIEGKSIVEFELPGAPDGLLRATVLEIERTAQTPDGEVQIPGLFAYWFVGRDRLAATNIERLAWFAWDRLTRLQSHRWAYIFAQTDIPDGREAGLERLQEIIGEVVPVVQSAGIEEG